jgi:hypothetical protein
MTGFFFVVNKDKILRSCIDNRGLNNITLKNRYHSSRAAPGGHRVLQAGPTERLPPGADTGRGQVEESVKAEKCEFHCSTIPFLGYIITAWSVQMDPGKVRAVVDWPQPTSRVQLLTVKMALEEWSHWTEGKEHPFIAWTGHKNLEYIRTTKRLNSRQARWALLFTLFKFSLSYRPGSKNIKPMRCHAAIAPRLHPRTPR